ncbi:MAG: hypothetical protein WA958_04035 [Tunicatimonas sp.]
MPQRDTNTTGKQQKGDPSASPGKSKAQIKDFKEGQDLEREEELREKFLDEDGNVDPSKAPLQNPNRNTDKTQTDPPSYGGGH